MIFRLVLHINYFMIHKEGMGTIRPMVRARETLLGKCYQLGLVEAASGAKLDPELDPQVEALTKALLQELTNHIPWCDIHLYIEYHDQDFL